jgi:hypothetical protein
MELSLPSKELAVRLLGKVRFEDRLEATRSTAMAGHVRSWIYTLQEAADFLHMSKAEELLQMGGKGSIGYIHPPALHKLVGEVYQDGELAAAIGEQIEKGKNYSERMEGIKRLLEHRLAQCRLVMRDGEDERGLSTE